MRFAGSVWCNLDIALRDLVLLLLNVLYEQDGQHASELKPPVGRAATCFTPILDKLQDKEMIERRPDTPSA